MCAHVHTRALESMCMDGSDFFSRCNWKILSRKWNLSDFPSSESHGHSYTFKVKNGFIWTEQWLLLIKTVLEGIAYLIYQLPNDALKLRILTREWTVDITLPVSCILELPECWYFSQHWYDVAQPVTWVYFSLYNWIFHQCILCSSYITCLTFQISCFRKYVLISHIRIFTWSSEETSRNCHHCFEGKWYLLSVLYRGIFDKLAILGYSGLLQQNANLKMLKVKMVCRLILLHSRPMLLKF